MKYKMARYHELDVKFISIYPDNLKNLDWIFRKRFQEVTGQYLPSGSRPREASEDSMEPDTATPLAVEGAGTACPDCPSCGQPMVLRTSRRGANAGTQFWGCSTYPACKGTRKYASPAI